MDVRLTCQRRVALGERALLAASGALPVAAVAAWAFGAALRTVVLLVVAPVAAGVLFRVVSHRPTRVLVTRAVLFGILATAPYDLWRGAFIWFGLIDHDPFPGLGAALDLQPAWLAGYAWRYVGDGAGLALAFLVFGFRGVRAGVAYGLAVCCGLLMTLVVSPYGETLLFDVSTTSVAMAVIGHVIFGGILGALAARAFDDRAYVWRMSLR